jgi:hypothetical protein
MSIEEKKRAFITTFRWNDSFKNFILVMGQRIPVHKPTKIFGEV